MRKSQFIILLTGLLSLVCLNNTTAASLVDRVPTTGTILGPALLAEDTLFNQLQGRLKTLHDKKYKSKKDGKMHRSYSVSYSKEFQGYYLTADQWKKLPEKQQLWLQSEFVRILANHVLKRQKDYKIPAIGSLSKWGRESNWATSIFCLKTKSVGCIKWKKNLCAQCDTTCHTDDSIREPFFCFGDMADGTKVFFDLVRRSHYTGHYPKSWKKRVMTSEQFLHGLVRGGYSTNNDSAKILSRKAESLQLQAEKALKSKYKKTRAKAPGLLAQADTLIAQAARIKPTKFKNIAESNDVVWLARTRAAITRAGLADKFGEDIKPSPIPGLPKPIAEVKKESPTPPVSKKSADTKKPATKPQAKKKPK